MVKHYFFLVSYFFSALSVMAQVDSLPADHSSFTLSGVVISSDSVVALPFTSIVASHFPQGTISDSTGFFRLDVYPADTLTFSAVGYKTAQFVVPDYLIGQQYSLVQAMVRDTIILEEVTIYSLPTTSEFMESFSDKAPDFEQRVTSMKTELKDILQEDIILSKYQPVNMHDGITRMYSAHWGIVPPNNFLNPMRWSQFVQDLRENRRRKQKK